VSVHECDGFIGFYSTLPSTSLGSNLGGLQRKMEIQSFDKERIEKILFESPQGLKLASRYFPLSFQRYSIENPKPVKIFADELSVNCEYCNSNLLSEEKKGMGIFVFLQKVEEEEGIYYFKEYQKAYFSCKGECDRILKNRYFQYGIYC